MPLPLVSIVIPCYKTSSFLDAAIQSCINQTWTDIEVIVVDDCSPDCDAEIAERYVVADSRVRLCRHDRNQGVAAAFNTGFRVARGEFMLRLAADDMLREDAVVMMMRHFEKHPEADIVYCDMQQVDVYGRYLYSVPTNEPESALFPTFRVGLCVSWKRKVWDFTNGFCSRYDTAEDYEFLLRATRCGFRLSRCGDGEPMFFRFHANQQGLRASRRQDVACLDAQLSHLRALFARSPWRLGMALRIMRNTMRLIVRRGLLYYHGVGAFRSATSEPVTLAESRSMER